MNSGGSVETLRLGVDVPTVPQRDEREGWTATLHELPHENTDDGGACKKARQHGVVPASHDNWETGVYARPPSM